MPFTPFHFGLSALPGLFSRGRLDLAIVAAANVLVDVEVLADGYFAPGWPVHQLWHFHTFLVGGAAGAVFGAAVYAIRPIQHICDKVNRLLGFSFRPSLLSMILSGIFGVWLHVLIDGFYHYDVQAFWPIQDNLLMKWAGGGNYFIRGVQKTVIMGCLAGWAIAGVVTIDLLYVTLRRRNSKTR